MNHAKTIIGFIFLSGGALAVWYALRQRSSDAGLSGVESSLSETQSESGTNSTNPRDGGAFSAASSAMEYEKQMSKWITPANGQKYEKDFIAASAVHGLPAGLLSRVAYQESRYNPKARSPVGAIGLMQFMPATAKDFGIDPLDPIDSIYASARYLKQLYNKFGNWKEAVAAYNWGQGNVARKGLAKAPAETRNYFAQILNDIGLG